MKYCTSCIAALVVAGPALADWSCNFNDGTAQGLSILDYTSGYTFGPAGGSLRFTSKGTGGVDDTVIGYKTESFTTVSALVLIRYSTDPQLAQPDWRFNGGVAVRLNPATVQGYVLVMNDTGNLQIIKATGGGAVTTLSHWDILFTPLQDWWMRFEAVTEGNTVRLRGRAWADGTAEDCEWQVECVDSSSIFVSGVASLVVNEDAYVQPGDFLDVDNVSISSTLSCQEVCDNNVDDNGNGLVDCRDPQCAGSPACQCHTPFADADGDGDVDMDDFAIFQRCYSGAGNPAPSARCGCFDRDDSNGDGHFQRLSDGDGDVDADDLAAFMLCRTGPNMPADPNCGG